MKKCILLIMILGIISAGCDGFVDELESSSTMGKIEYKTGLNLDGNKDGLYNNIESCYKDSVNDTQSEIPGNDITEYYFAKDDQYLWLYIALNDDNPSIPDEGGDVSYSCAYSGYFMTESQGTYLLCVGYNFGWDVNMRNVSGGISASINADLSVSNGLEIRINKSDIPFDYFEFIFSSYNYDDITAIRKFWLQGRKKFMNGIQPGMPFRMVFNYNPVLSEPVKSAVGSIGMFLCVPVTALISVKLYKRKYEKVSDSTS